MKFNERLVLLSLGIATVKHIRNYLATFSKKSTFVQRVISILLHRVSVQFVSYFVK